jgi:hypothetical protein
VHVDFENGQASASVKDISRAPSSGSWVCTERTFHRSVEARNDVRFLQVHFEAMERRNGRTGDGRRLPRL